MLVFTESAGCKKEKKKATENEECSEIPLSATHSAKSFPAEKVQF